MTSERWEQIAEIYQAAQEFDSSERKDFLDRVCAGDEPLRREVESLLAADAEAGDFIAQPVLKDLAGLLTADDGASSLVGRKIGHYRIISQLGAGGMGEVFLAEDAKLGRRVALKTLPDEFSGDSQFLERFRTEARAAAALNHPCIATLYAVEEFDEGFFIALEYVEGKSLAEVISEGETDSETALDLFLCLADALAHSHEQGVIHRDIKPANVLIKTDGVPKILDFGLARIEPAGNAHPAATRALTQSGQVFGTPSYMSPEQAEGRAVDHRSDIFSLGVLMYEIVTGTRPFKGDSYASVVSELLKTEPPPVSELKPRTPRTLARLIENCLRKSPAARPSSMREVCDVLEKTKADLEAGSSAKGAVKFAPTRAGGFSRRWIFAPLALAVGALLAAVALYQITWQRMTAVRFDHLALRKLSQTNNVVFAQITPDGKSVVYQTIEGEDRRALWVRRVEDKNALQLVAPRPVVFWGGFAVSPDNSQIFYIAAEPGARHGALYRISSIGGAARKLVEAANDVGAVSPDGARILFVRYGRGGGEIISARALDGGDERVIQIAAPHELFRDPKFSPDGARIYYSKLERRAGEEFWSLVAIPAAGGAEQTILEPRKERIGELAVLKGGGILINKTDAISNLQQIFHVALPGGELQRVTNDLNSYFGISANDGGDAFVATQRQETSDLWVASGAGAAKKVTAEPNVYRNVVFAPDGKIVFDATDNNRPHVWAMNADGTGAQQLTPNDSSDSEPRVSPDGRLIVFTSERTGERKVWRMNVDGSSPQMLTAVGGATSNPFIAPDAQSVWFSWAQQERRVIGKIPISGGGAITEQPPFGNSLWAIAPDGKRVACVFYDEPSREYKVRVRPLEADEPSIVFDISPTRFLTWTADGKNLLYREIEPRRASNSTVWMQPLAGGAPKAFLTTAPEEVFNVAQSADGKQTAIVRGKITSDAVLLSLPPTRQD